MLTLLSSFKAFKDNAAFIQNNSLTNWRNLGNNVEIIIYGNGEGVADSCSKFGAKHAPDIECSPNGLPLFTAIAAHAQAHAKFDTQVYLNGDILLPPDFASVATSIKLEKYLAVGRKINLLQGATYDAFPRDWLRQLKDLHQAGLVQHADPGWMDYFVFPRGLWKDLKPLVIGRGRYDCALVAHCLRYDIPLVDTTHDLFVLHQYHEYNHVKGGDQMVRYGPDGVFNMNTHDLWHSPPDIRECSLCLVNGDLEKQQTRDFLRETEMRLRFHWGQKYPSYFVRALWRLLNRRDGQKRYDIDLQNLIDQRLKRATGACCGSANTGTM
jgi:hypothetical protein